MIFYNQVYQYADKEDKNRIRIIEIDHPIVHFVELHGDTSMPKEIKVVNLEMVIQNSILLPIPDPYSTTYMDKDLTETQIQKRDENWALVSIGWEKYKDELLNKRKRNSIFDELAHKYSVSNVKVKRAFTRFWQRGLNKNALLPDYMYSGGRGKGRKLSLKAKVGRPRTYSSQGINITEDVKKQFSYVVKKYYSKKEQLTLTDTYEYLLREFYSDKYYVGEALKYKTWDDSRIPTYHQFYYWFKKFEEPQLDFELRQSSKEYELKHRPILSHSALETDGPGTRFQIDATIADIYLVSSFDRNLIIGRPVVYGVVDVYSRLLVGIYVGLGGPSWVGAMMALDNTVTNKVEFCKMYDIEINQAQWPAQHLPEIIIADRGEFEGYSVENLINNLNVKIENTSPYRGDLKGIIERQFRTLNGKVKRKAPGAIQKEYRERGDRDYRLDASLTLEEFTQIVIHIVLHHNQKVIDKYPLEKEMIAEQITATPINLWEWGLANKKGRLQAISDHNLFRMNLLPKGKARITRAGIKFKGLAYGSEKALNEQWYLKMKNQSIEVVYDPRSMNHIYVPHKDGRSFDVCYLLDTSIQYKDNSFDEVEFYKQLLQESKTKEKNQQVESTINTDSAIESIIKEAVIQKKKTINLNQTKSEQIKNIRVNRQVEKLVNRQDEKFDLGPEKKQQKAQIVKFTKEESEPKTQPTSRLMAKLRKKRDEELGKDD
ncbi:Mu transposase C-terminal domain-containing protein [Staphylococcus pseudintermedius]|uniref:Mu transposase C-terminal domain-containing protein n=1 Tax=Staphylococcus pseudintermedius TaxID=283734 RepID=UPI000D7390EB|nr:Mu transposase C-terminal domain-containing protein [Staphylococcus pseudintermedius]PWZ35603.1 transposase [Staphylococcus pseudintermedius]PWZ60506.1 transposase [Staphylococcus pseudintermedius]PXA14963.1 transposase [Staphylococcus pseudintermedius]